jgi:hypothetical protein
LLFCFLFSKPGNLPVNLQPAATRAHKVRICRLRRAACYAHSGRNHIVRVSKQLFLLPRSLLRLLHLLHLLLCLLLLDAVVYVLAPRHPPIFHLILLVVVPLVLLVQPRWARPPRRVLLVVPVVGRPDTLLVVG